MSNRCVKYPDQNNTLYGNNVRASSKLITNQIQTIQKDVCLYTRDITTGIKGIGSLSELRSYLASLNGAAACILLKPGSYILTSPLTIPGNVKLMGCDTTYTNISLAASFDVSQTPISIAGSNVTIEGLSIGGANLALVNGCVVSVSLQSNITFRNVLFENTDTNVAALCLVGTNNILVQDCQFVNCDIGVLLLGLTQDTDVVNCNFSGTNAYGVDLQQVDPNPNIDVNVSGCSLTDQNSIRAVNADRLNITNCILEDASTVLLNNDVVNANVVNCTFTNTTGNEPIDCDSIDNLVIQGNTVSTTLLTAITVSDSNNVDISGNVVTDAASGITLSSSNYASITGNTVKATTGNAIRLADNTKTIVSSNMAYVDPGTGGTGGILMLGNQTDINISSNFIEAESGIIFGIGITDSVIHNNSFGVGISNSNPVAFPTQVLSGQDISIKNNSLPPGALRATASTGSPLPFGSSATNQLNLINSGAPNNFIQMEPLPLACTGHSILLNAQDVAGGTITIEFNGAIFADGTTIDLTADGATAQLTWMGTQWTCFGTLGLSAAGAAIVP